MQYIKEKIGIDIKDALIPFISGLIAHGYIMFSYSPNKDEFISIFHHGSGYDFGRWFHTMIGNFMFRIDGCYSMPWLNGLIYISFISLAAILFADPFDIKNKLLKYLFMVLFMVFPVTTATLSYMATAPFYAFGIFLVALAFFVSAKYKYGFVFGIFSLCCSIGIYQAYFSLLATFVFFLFFMKLLSDETFKDSFVRAIKHVFMLVAGLVLYFAVNKLIILTKQVKMTDYQNLSEMGNYSASSLAHAFGKCYTDFFKTFTQDYYYIFPYRFLNIVLSVAWVIFVVGLVYLMVTCLKKKWLNAIFILGLTSLIPFAIFLINLMCAEFLDGIYTLMCYSAFFMLAGPMLVVDRVCARKLKLTKIAVRTVETVLFLVIFLYVKYANMAYLGYNIHYEQAYFEFSSLATRIRSVEGYDNMIPIVFVGKYEDTSRLWELRYADALPGAYNTEYVMNGEERRANFFRFFLGFNYSEAYPSEELLECASFKEMPSYPDDGSIKLVNDQIIVKFSN